MRTGTPPPTMTSSSTALPSGTPPVCFGDCDVNGHITIDELIRGVAIALDAQPLSVCASLDTNRDGRVDIGELIAAVAAALRGCSGFPQCSGCRTAPPLHDRSRLGGARNRACRVDLLPGRDVEAMRAEV